MSVVAPVVAPPAAPAAPITPEAGAAAPVIPPAAPTAEASKAAAEKLKVLRDRGELAKQAQAIAADRAAHAEDIRLATEYKALRASKDPVAAMRAAGMTPDEIAKKLVQGDLTPEAKAAALEADVKATKDEVTKLRTERDEALKLQQTSQYQEARQEAHNIVTEAIATYPLINGAGLHDQVLDELKAMVKAGNADPDLHEAAKTVEERLSKTLPNYWSNLAKSPAMRALMEAALAPAVDPAKPVDAAKPAATAADALLPPPSAGYRKKVTPHTLTNAISSSPAATSTTATKPKSIKEAQAKMLAEWNSRG